MLVPKHNNSNNVPAAQSDLYWKKSDVVRIIVAIGASLLPQIAILLISQYVANAQKLTSHIISAIGLVPIFLLLSTNARHTRSTPWLLRFGVLFAGQILGYVAQYAYLQWQTDVSSATGSILVSCVGAITSAVLPLWTTEDPMKNDPSLTLRSSRIRKVLMLCIVGVLIPSLLWGIDYLLPR